MTIETFESGATAALFGPVLAVVGGGLGTVAVTLVVALAWPQLARIGPFDSLHPTEPEPEPANSASASYAGPLPP